MKKLPVKKEFPWQKIGSFARNDGYTIAFVYPKKGEAFIVKGGSQDVREYLEKLDIPAFVHYTLWHKGESRTIHEFFGIPSDLSIFYHCRYNEIRDEQGYARYKFQGFELTVHNNHGPANRLRMVRRVPRCWPKELNEFV